MWAKAGWVVFLAPSSLLAAGALEMGPALVGGPGLPEVSFSVLRLLGALLVVLAIFFGGVWLFRNWERLVRARGLPRKLQVLEMRSLGNRHALFVVGYEQRRLLIASSPSGVTLLDRLPAASEAPPEGAAASTAFAETLRKLWLSR